MGQAIIYSDGTIRCEKCEQLLKKGQLDCPSCNNHISHYSRVGNAYRKNVPRKVLYGADFSKKRKNPKEVLGIIVCFFAIVIFCGRFLIPQMSKLNKNQVAIPQRHTDAPLGHDEYVGTGFDYHITQVFLESELNDATAKEMQLMLNECNINYSNFRYTDEGYYSADLQGYGPYDKDEFETRVDQMQDMFRQWIEDEYAIPLTGKTITCQGWYEQIR